MKQLLKFLLCLITTMYPTLSIMGDNYQYAGTITVEYGSDFEVHLPYNYETYMQMGGSGNPSWTASNDVISVRERNRGYCKIHGNIQGESKLYYVGGYVIGSAAETILFYWNITVVSPKPQLSLTANPEGGKIAANSWVKLLASDDRAIIYYTLDGTNPKTSSSTQWPTSQGVQIKQSCTLTAYAKVMSTGAESGVMSWDYTVYSNGDSFIFPTEEGLKMRFTIIDAEANLCQVGRDGPYMTINESYTGKVTIPEEANGFKVTAIGKKAFMDYKITSIYLPNTITNIGWSAFSGTRLSSIELPNSLTSISDYAFSCCTSLEKISFGNKISSLGSHVFDYCTSLKNIEFPPNISTLGGYCFSSCENLETIDISENIQSIEEGCFVGCGNVKSVIIRKIQPIYIKYYAFNAAIYYDATLYVPKGSKDLYQNATGWKNFRNIVEFDSSGLNDIKNDKRKNSSIYNLSGQRLAIPEKGINLISGKKVIIR